MEIEVSGQGFARRWSALGVVVGEVEIISFGQPRLVTRFGGTSIAIGRETANEAPVGLRGAAARHGTLHCLKISRAFLEHLRVVPSCRRVRAHFDLTPGLFRKQQPRGRRLATVLCRALGRVGVERGNVVSTG